MAARLRLGGNGNLLDPFPKPPRGMHWRTYGRLQVSALVAEERMVGLELDWLRTRYGVSLGPPPEVGLELDLLRTRYGVSLGPPPD
jgi:hypothetical protein